MSHLGPNLDRAGGDLAGPLPPNEKLEGRSAVAFTRATLQIALGLVHVPPHARDVQTTRLAMKTTLPSTAPVTAASHKDASFAQART